MRRQWKWLGLFVATLMPLAGCGSLPDDAGNRLIVTEVIPESGKDGFFFPAVETVSNDVGSPEGDINTANNGFFDGAPEVKETPLGADLIDITLRNETRKGVDEGRPVVVYAIRITYFDEDGNTPAYAPQRSLPWSLEVPADGTATVTNLPVTSKEMKTAGLRDLFFTGAADAEVQVTAVIDLFAEDSLNAEGFTVQTAVRIHFVNPNI